jgi:predicted Zn-dependent protease
MDARFVRTLALTDDEIALVLAHEAAHVIAAHGSAKLSFMAGFLGKEKLPTAHKALVEFFSTDSYATVFQPMARLQEREADRLGAVILSATAYDAQRALKLFDKLAALEALESGKAGKDTDSHDAALVRKQAVSATIADQQARRSPAPL